MQSSGVNNLLGRTFVYRFFLSVPTGRSVVDTVSLGSFCSTQYCKSTDIILASTYSKLSFNVTRLSDSDSQLTHCHWPTQHLDWNANNKNISPNSSSWNYYHASKCNIILFCSLIQACYISCTSNLFTSYTLAHNGLLLYM